MIFFAAVLIGAMIGWIRAGRRDGNRLDKLQYAAAHAIFFAIVGVFVALAISRFS